MTWLLLGALLTHDGTCRTRCGLMAAGNCAELQRTEDLLLRAITRHIPEFNAKEACSGWEGWVVIPHPRNLEDHICGADAWFVDRLPRPDGKKANLCVRGFTHPGVHLIETLDTEWLTNALAHELLHVVDGLRNPDYGHCRWKARGLKAAIFEVTGEEDTSPPETECADFIEIR